MRWINFHESSIFRSMKTLIVLTISMMTVAAQALPIKNFFAVTSDEMVLRGAQPLGKAVDLKEAGVTQVLIFKNDTKGEVEREKAELLEAGFSAKNIHHIPMGWKDVDLDLACEQTVKALQTLIKASKAQESIFFHCTAGEDRTGMLAGLFRMATEGIKTDEAFQNEMCDRGYSDGNPNKPGNVTGAIELGLTPLFMALAERIEAGQKITKKLCQDLELNHQEVPSCN